MARKNLSVEVGDTVLVTQYVANFDEKLFAGDPRGRHYEKKPWGPFHAEVLKADGYERAMVLDVRHSPELTKEQKRRTQTGRICVSRKYIVGAQRTGKRLIPEFAMANKKAGEKPAGLETIEAARKEEREALADAAAGLFAKGYTVSEAAAALSTTAMRINRAIHEAGIPKPETKFARLIYKDSGYTKYFATTKEACTYADASPYQLLTKRQLETKRGVLQAGKWLIWKGHNHVLKEAEKVGK